MIGVVTGVQGMRWYEVTVTGFESHAGTTPMHLRRDALVGASRMVEAINKVALDHPPLAVSTVGLMEVRPNSRNILPGEVFFTIDLRHPEDEVVAALETEVKAAIERIAEELKLEIKVEQVWDSPAVKTRRARRTGRGPSSGRRRLSLPRRSFVPRHTTDREKQE